MLAVAETATADQIVELDKPGFHIRPAHVAQTKLANTRGVDQLAATREVEQPRRGRGVRALTGNFGQWSDPQVDLGQQAVDQRRLAHARLTHKHTDVPVQLGLQLLHAVAVMCGHFQHRITQLTINPQQRIQRRGVLLVNQVGFVEQQQRTNPRMLGGDQITVDQVGVWLGHRREHNHDHVDVGGNRLELATAVWAAQFGFAGQLGDDHANPLVARAPYDGVTGHQGWQVGTQVTPEHLAFELAFLGLDLDLHTEVRDHQTELLGAQIAPFKRFDGTGFAFGGAGSALALDLFDAPVLATVELAFGHGCSVLIKR